MAQMKTLNGYEVVDQYARENYLTWTQIWQKIYPIGAVYISYLPTSPASLFGGTWEIIKNRFLYASGGESMKFGGTNDLRLLAGIGATNGEPSYIGYATAGIPRAFDKSGGIYTYSLKTVGWHNPGGNVNHTTVVYPNNGYEYDANATGEDALQINNMPQYVTMFMWRRTA